MNQDKTHSQTFNHQLSLQEQVANKWGYHLNNQPYKQSAKNKPSHRSAATINNSIQPLNTKEVKVKKSERHLQLEKEIQAHEYEKKMMEKKSKDKNIMRMLNDRIVEYNYLIDHKHIKEKNSEDTKKVLGLKPKTQAELILEQINQKNKELVSTQNLKTQFRLNKKIANLYRTYKDRMYQPQNLEEYNLGNLLTGLALQKKKSFSENKNRTLESIAQRKKSVKLRDHQLSFSSQSEKDQRSNEIVQIDQPYVSKQYMNKSKEIDNSIIATREMASTWKQKIKNSLKVTPKLRKSQNIKQSEKQKSQQNRLNRFLDGELVDKLRQKRKTQEKYVSSFLGKRNLKFKKPWGNKILIKYNSDNEAKDLLGVSPQASPQKRAFETLSYFGKAENKNQASKKIPEDITRENLQILQSMRGQQQNEEYYQLMCKNEKINLFLKKRKH